MILASASRRHAFHFGEGGDDGGVAADCAYKCPEETGEASIDETGREGAGIVSSIPPELVYCKAAYTKTNSQVAM